jgi:hypothetical protein
LILRDLTARCAQFALRLVNVVGRARQTRPLTDKMKTGPATLLSAALTPSLVRSQRDVQGARAVATAAASAVPARGGAFGGVPRLFSVLVGSNAASAKCFMLFCAGALRIPDETMEVLGRIPASPTKLTAFSDASCTSRPAVLMLQRTRSGDAAGPGPFHTGHRPRWLAHSGQLPLLGFLAGCLFLAVFDAHLRHCSSERNCRRSVGHPVTNVGEKSQERTTARMTAQPSRTTRLPPHKVLSSSCRC